MGDPKTAQGMTEGGASAIVESAKELGRLSTTEIDRLSLQWTAFIAAKFAIRDKQRLDDFYSKCLKKLCSNDEPYLELKRFLKMALCLPSGNASVERGFSASKRLIDSR